jgi:hypothetical protein
MSIVNRSESHAKPASQEIAQRTGHYCRIAKATLGKRSTANWDDLTVNYAKIRDSIARVIPGFRKFQRADSRGLPSSATLCPRSQRIPKPAAQGEGHRWTAAGAVCRPDQSLQRREPDGRTFPGCALPNSARMRGHLLSRGEPLVHLESVSEIRNTPALKSVIISITPSRESD